ncbi:MAG: hypothetical protein LQ345_004317, partial [Seirophora villosa]
MTIVAFTNARICRHGALLPPSCLYFDTAEGLIVPPPDSTEVETIDLQNRILAPAFLELQTNGCIGVHFTSHRNDEEYVENLEKVSKWMVTKGVGGWWATVPTVGKDVYRKVLPLLEPRTFNDGAALLGAHCEGPFLNASKKGAHNASLMQNPSESSISGTYGPSTTSIKLLTLAPELPSSTALTAALTRPSNNFRVSLGHSAASYATGLVALRAGATCLTHVFNAMEPLHHRTPGLAGLIASSPTQEENPPYFSLIADGIHLHPATLTLAFRANPARCILITDSIEVAGLPDGLHPGNAQVAHPQRKVGSRVTIEGTDTLIGSCCGIDECVGNLAAWSGCTVAEAVRCVTENVAAMMGLLGERGVLEVGRKADFVVLGEEGVVVQET